MRVEENNAGRGILARCCYAMCCCSELSEMEDDVPISINIITPHNHSNNNIIISITRIITTTESPKTKDNYYKYHNCSSSFCCNSITIRADYVLGPPGRNTGAVCGRVNIGLASDSNNS